MPIRTLPTALVNQIAAGEVVERPASVAKELIENALDAGARAIVVRIEGGGRERLEVIDDGVGIAPDELALALAPHATSKISTSDDLNCIRTFGFRGEALCAISAVSHVKLTSMLRAAANGTAQAWSIESRFGVVGEVKPSAGVAGTAIEVRGLFENVPARRKFLRGDPAEAARITEVVCNAALSNPTVSFRLESGGRRVIDLVAATDIFGRIADVFGEALGESPLTVAGESVADEMTTRIVGVICRPSNMRAVSRTQRILVNGRPIIDRSLIHAVREAYRGLAEPSLHPVFVLLIEVDPTAVDVNVHPQKSEVRWRSPAMMHRAVYRSVQDALRSQDLTASDESLLAKSKDDLAPQGRWSAEPPRSRSPWHSGAGVAGTLEASSVSQQDARNSTAMTEQLIEVPTAARRILQIDETWIVFAEDGALVIVDQHALHERVMFEELRRRVLCGDLMSQQLLVPATADVPPEALAHLETLAPLFRRLGIEAAAAGPRTVAVHAFPGFLTQRRVHAATFVARALTNDALISASESTEATSLREAALADILDTMACKAAVKGGDRLSPEEINRLLNARDSTDRATNCPHGRPTSIRIPMADIERRFGRR